ncbi:hypothetical protein ES705_25747 [subsurface metagenome]
MLQLDITSLKRLGDGIEVTAFIAKPNNSVGPTNAASYAEQGEAVANLREANEDYRLLHLGIVYLTQKEGG